MDFSAGNSVKEEDYVGSSSLQYWNNGELTPRPLEALIEAGPPPFLSKTYDFVEDPCTNELVSWSPGFQCGTMVTGSRSNWKVDADRWEFANEGFLRGQKHLLKNIVRRKTHYPSSQTSIKQSLGSCVELKSCGLDGDIDRLWCDKRVIATELVKHRQQQQTTRSWLKTMEHRLEGAERKQKETVSLLAKAIQNPTLLQKKLQQKDEKNEPEDGAINKRRRGILDHVSRNVGIEELVFEELGQGSMENAYKNDVGNFYVKPEPQEYEETPRFGDSELEKLALSMQKSQVIMEENPSQKRYFQSFDEGFWEELINQGIDEIGKLGAEEGGFDLAEQLELILGSNQR